MGSARFRLSARDQTEGHVATGLVQQGASALGLDLAGELVGRVYLERRKTKRSGLFIAKVVGSSMNRVAPDGSWCLWQHLGAAGAPPAVPGEYLLVRREDPDDPALGGFTFKRWVRAPDGARLTPVTREPGYAPILLTPEDEQTTAHLARFIEVLHLDDSEITT